MKRDWWMIQNVDIEGPGLFGNALDAAGFSSRVIPVWSGAEVPESPDGAAGIAILGGPMGVYERDRFPFLAREMTLARRAAESGVPFLGICLGSQILAEAMGGRVYPGKSAELGWGPATLTGEGLADPVLGGAGPRLDVFHWHGDTFDLPPGAVRLASSPLYPNQAFRWGTRAYALQFHLEFTPAIIHAVLADPGNRQWMKTGRSGGPERSEGRQDLIAATEAAISADTASLAAACADRGREIFQRFLALARG
jgi:GMP synthase-like glutamine amidotransferase